ncbi:MAG: flagellar hook-basal body complex protein, partial [Parvibaculum sp.]|nr:flagellar hook-basal body complex protein [Parvibaculum sp.]
MQSLSIAATGMMAQQLNVEVISNNIANMSTTGFKRGRAEFQDLLYQNLRRVGANSSDAGTIVPAGVQVGLGVKTAAVNRIMTQGNMDNTENKLDVAIQGRGYFRIELPSGDDAYTRAGSFDISA